MPLVPNQGMDGKNKMITTIENDGPDIVTTNYWTTEHEQRGLFYVSINAGTCRLLVPAV